MSGLSTFKCTVSPPSAVLILFPPLPAAELHFLFLSPPPQVVSLTEYHRRIDALNSEDLKSLCKRLQVPHSAKLQLSIPFF